MATKRKQAIGRPSEGLEVVLYVRITKDMHRRLVRLRKELSARGVPVSEAAVVRQLLASGLNLKAV